MLVSLSGRKKGRGSLVARKRAGEASIPYLHYCNIPMSSGSGCASFSSSHVLCLWQWWWSRMSYTKMELSNPAGRKKGLGDQETSAAGPWGVPSPRKSPDTEIECRLSAPTCSKRLAEIPAHTAPLVVASHKMPESVIYNMTVLKKCFHKLVSCCFALADKCFWNFPITMFYSLYLLYCYF